MILSVYTAKLPAEGMGRMDAIEQKILQVIDAHAEEIKAFGRDIFHHAELGYQETDHYAKITVTDPFSNPFEKITGAYGKIYEFAKERHIIARSYKDRICMEEVFIKDGVTYMDVYVPVDNG